MSRGRVLTGVLCLAAALLGPIAAARAAMPLGEILTYPVPTASSNPFGIAAGSDGNLWFTEAGTNAIAAVTAGGSFAGPYTVPTTGADPEAIAAGSNGSLWFTEPDQGKVGEISTTGSFTQLPVAGAGSLGPITAGTDSALWFTDSGKNSIDRIPVTATPSNPQVTSQTIPTAGASPAGIAADADGDLWFTEQGTSKVGELVPPDTFHEYSTKRRLAGPGAVPCPATAAVPRSSGSHRLARTWC